MNEQPLQVGRFPILKTLGTGGMGVVYLAKDPDIGRKVAIKVLHSTNDPEALQRFKNEARTMGEISHPNIVVLLEYGIDDSKPFLVMEYLEGQSLEKWQKTIHTLEEHKKILLQLCSALDFSHQKQILHRDLKPGNVQILPSGDAKLLDFGIATGEQTGLTKTGFFIGTPKYIAPEILQDTTHTKSSDCYSLGLIAYTMLSGNNPFSAQSIEATMTRLLTKIPIPLHTLNSKIPTELSNVIELYLGKNPENRPNSTKNLQLTLELITKPAILKKEITPNLTSNQLQSQDTTLLVQPQTKPYRKVVITMALLSLAAFSLFYLTVYNRKQNPINQSTIITKATLDKNKLLVENKALELPEGNITNPVNKTDEILKQTIEAGKNKNLVDNQNTDISTNIIIPDVQSKNTDTAQSTKPKVKKKVTTQPIIKPITKPIVRQEKKPIIVTPVEITRDVTIDKTPIITYQKPQEKIENKPIFQLPKLTPNSKKIVLKTNSNTEISRGKSHSITIELPSKITIDEFKIKRGKNDFKQVEIKTVNPMGNDKIKVSLYAHPNASMGAFSLIGYYKDEKTKPLILEVIL